MRRLLLSLVASLLGGAWLYPLPSAAQTTVPHQASALDDTLRSTSTLVVVPTLVRSPLGELVPSLTARDFHLLDNGVQQSVTLEDEPERRPVALVALLQIGGAARRDLAAFAGFATLLDSIIGQSAHRAALVTFDSQPEEQWDFTEHLDRFTDGLRHLKPGDDGAAILDAVTFGIHLLQTQPPAVRRVLVVISQRRDAGSRVKLEAVVRSLGENNVAIYCLSFSPEQAWLKDQFTEPRHENAPYQLGPAGPTLLHTFDLGTPLGVALHALQTNTAAELALLAGGESFNFTGRHDLEKNLATIANHDPNRYLLTFQPTAPQPGFHTIAVSTPSNPDNTISARSSYWSGPHAQPQP